MFHMRGQLYMGLTGNNNDGAQMLIKAFYFEEELIRLDCPIKVELLGRHNLLWYRPSACFPWRGSGKWLEEMIKAEMAAVGLDTVSYHPSYPNSKPLEGTK